MCAVNTGDELAAAALTRGLDNPTPRTHLARIGFHLADWIVLFGCAALLTAWAIGGFR
jgi:energy-coupling factor transport system permease protein